MSIELRDDVVVLYQGSYDKRIRELLDATERAKKADATEGRRRMATGQPEWMRLATECDALVEEATESAVKVRVWALDYLEWREFADKHPPRDGERRDQLFEINLETAPDELLLLSLVEVPDGEAMDLDERRAAGEKVLKALGRMSRNNYMKLSHAAWTVNTADDAIPKSSVLSAYRDGSEPSSKEPASTG